MAWKGTGTTFKGSLDDLSVVDVLQALRVSQKTGLLVLRAAGAEAALSFKEGRVVSCRHPKSEVNVGHLLVERGAVRASDVERAVRVQAAAQAARKPLVGTLVDMGALDQEVGWKALEDLVELTVAEVQNWSHGTFAFGMKSSPSPGTDGFRHTPTAAGSALATNTQRLMTEALQILEREGDASDDRRTTSGTESQRAFREMASLRDCVREIRFPEGPGDVSLVMFRHMAKLVERILLFLVRDHDLLALGSVGIDDDPEKASDKLTRLKLPLDRGTTLDALIREGMVHFGPPPDPGLVARLHTIIGPPVSSDVVLLPLRTRERPVALLYGDFGDQPSRAVDTMALEIAANVAGMAFELALHERASSGAADEPVLADSVRNAG